MCSRHKIKARSGVVVHFTRRAPKGKPERPSQPVIDQQKLNRMPGGRKFEVLAERRKQKEEARRNEAEARLQHERKKKTAAR